MPVTVDCSSGDQRLPTTGEAPSPDLWRSPRCGWAFASGVACATLVGQLRKHVQWVGWSRHWWLEWQPHHRAGSCFPKRNYISAARWLRRVNSSQPDAYHVVDRVLKRRGYAVGYSEAARTPLWAGYYLHPEAVGLCAKHSKEWWGATNYGFAVDRSVPSAKQHSAEQFSGTGFDRGHLAPRAAVAFSEESARESYLLTNVVLQDAKLNRGVWREMEGLVRFWTAHHHQRGEDSLRQRFRHFIASNLIGGAPGMAVCVGPVFSKGGGSRHVNGVRVPEMLFMAVQDLGSRRSVGWLLPNVATVEQDRRCTAATRYANMPNRIRTCDATMEQYLRYEFLQSKMMSVAEVERHVRAVSGCTSFALFRHLPRPHRVAEDSPLRHSVDLAFWRLPSPSTGLPLTVEELMAERRQMEGKLWCRWSPKTTTAPVVDGKSSMVSAARNEPGPAGLATFLKLDPACRQGLGGSPPVKRPPKKSAKRRWSAQRQRTQR